MQKTTIETGDQKHEVEVADRVIDHFIGMRTRKEGKMLFDFGRTSNPRIDMLLVKTELHLYFLDEDKQVVEKQKAMPWSWNPKTWRFYRANQKYRYLLESSEELNLKEGDEIGFQL